MKYLGIAIGVFSALVMWPFLPFLIIGALVIAAFKGLKQNAHGPKPAPMPPPAVRDPMLGKVFAQARARTHSLNVDHMERCFRHPCER